MPLDELPHIKALQRHLMRYGIGFALIGTVSCWYANLLYNWLAKPLLQALPEGSKLIATEITTPFMVPLKFSLFFSFLLTLPYLFYEMWRFIQPGLYPEERQRVWPFLSLSLCLFYGGILFGYHLICPVAIQFFMQTTPSSVTLMIDIAHYSSFMLSICGYAGLVFETPILTFGLIQLNCVSIAQMIYFRKYVIVGAFVIGMLLTPPDVLSQIMLAIPMWGLYEAGILAARWVRYRKTMETPQPQ
ncbi:MAG: twin-arginine translocase subunit TatC [Pseudomonadota bacterium]